MFKDIVNPIRENPDFITAGCVEIYDEIINRPDNLIKIAESMEGWRDAHIYEDVDNAFALNKEYRSNSILDINSNLYNTHPIFTYVSEAVEQYLLNYAGRYGVSFSYVEPVQLLRYYPGQYYKAHYDTGPEFPRVISALLYLNDIDMGGETHFNHFDVDVLPKAGRLAIFPSNYAYEHSAMPPVDDIKYVFVFWTREIIINCS